MTVDLSSIPAQTEGNSPSALPKGALLGSFASVGLIQLLLLLTGVLSARLLGPEDRGYLAMLLIVPVAAAQLISFGQPSAVTYFLSRSDIEAKQLGRLVAPILLVQLGLAFALLTPATYYFLDVPHFSFLACLSLTITASAFTIFQQYLLALAQGANLLQVANVCVALPLAGYFLILVPVSIAGDLNLRSAAASWVVGTSIGTTVSLILILQSIRGAPSSSTDTHITVGTFARYGARGFLSNSGVLDTIRLDQLLVAAALPAASLGIYVAALAFTNLHRFIGSSIGRIAFPVVSRASDDDSARTKVQQFLLLTGAAALAIAILLSLMSDLLVNTLYGSEFSRASPVLRILLVGAGAFTLKSVSNECLKGLGRPGMATLAEVCTLVFLGVTALAVLNSPSLELVAVGVSIATVCGSVASMASLGAILHHTNRSPQRNMHQHTTRKYISK